MVFALFLIPAFWILNRLGGDGGSRILCRVILMPLAFGVAAQISGIDMASVIGITLASIAGFALWAVPAWGQQFMAITGQDNRSYSKYAWISGICDFCICSTPLITISSEEARDWGTIYGCIRGAFLYPLFIFLAVYLTPWAIAIGLLCFFQGVVYRHSPDVSEAECAMGCLIGSCLAAVLIINYFQ